MNIDIYYYIVGIIVNKLIYQNKLFLNSLSHEILCNKK
jgi:hypothetical protein